MRLVLKWIRNIVALFFATTILWVVMLRFVPVLTTPLMFIRAIEQLKEGKDFKWEHCWTSIGKMPYFASTAVIAGEDQNFMNHHGFDFKAIEQAAQSNLDGNRRMRGGSTITQQTAKNVFLWPGRNWLRKGLETYFTILIELTWSKERILEVYLNSVEMGDGIYGLQAAAQQYWQKDVSKLTRMQCATIAATLPNPRKYSATNPGPYVQKRASRIYKDMKYLERQNMTLYQ